MGVGIPFLGRVAEDRGRLRADVDGSLRALDPLDVRRRGRLLDQRAMTGLDVSHTILDLVQPRDVVHDTLPEERLVARRADENRLVSEPDDTPIACEHPVFEGEGLIGSLDALVLLDGPL